MGKFVNFFLNDSLASLLALSVLASVASYLLLSRAFHPLVGLVAAFIPIWTVPLPDAVAVACFAAAMYFWMSRQPVAFGIAAAAVVGVMPQTIFAMVVLVAVSGAGGRRLKTYIAFVVMLFVEFLQVVQNIELGRLRAFVEANTDLRCAFQPLAAKAVAAAVLLALTYHFLGAKADDLPRRPDVQRGGEH